MNALVDVAPVLVEGAALVAGVDRVGPGRAALWLEGPLRIGMLLRALYEHLERGEPSKLRARSARSSELALWVPKAARALIPGTQVAVRLGLPTVADDPEASFVLTHEAGVFDALATALTHVILEGRRGALHLDEGAETLLPLLHAVTAPFGEHISLSASRTTGGSRALPPSPGLSPTVFVPYLHESDAIRYQARALVSEVVRGALSPVFDMPVVILPRDHPQHTRLVTEIRDGLAHVAPVLRDGQPLPWLVLDDLSSNDLHSLVNEPLRGALAVLTKGTMADAPAQLREAVAVCNEGLGGGRAATIVVHPYQAEEPELAKALSEATKTLRFGAVGINAAASGARIAGLPWGSTLSAWGSLVGRPVEKVVLRGPLVSLRTPASFVDHRRMPVLALTLLEGVLRGGVGPRFTAFLKSLAA